MNILLATRWPVGGIKTYIRYIYGSSEFTDVSITLLAPPEDLADFISSQLPVGRIRLVETSTDPLQFMRDMASLVRKQPFDLVHSHGFSASMLAQIALIWSSIPHIMTAHDVFLPNTFNGFAGRLKKYAMKWLLSSVDLVLSVSEDARQNIFEYFPALRSSQVMNITNGIDTEFFKNAKARQLKQELAIPSDQPLIGFFGRFMAQKGFHQIISAVEILINDASLIAKPLVVTFGWGGFIREDFALIEQKGLSKFFIQLPGTDDMPAALRGVDLVVMPSRWEACPLLPMEVLSCGIPIIGSNCIGLREVLSGTPAKVINVGDAKALAEAIKSQLQIGPKAFLDYQPIAIERFDAREHARQLKELYAQQIGAKRK